MASTYMDAVNAHAFAASVLHHHVMARRTGLLVQHAGREI